MSKEREIKEFLRNNLEIVIDFDDKYSGGNNQTVGLRFKGEKECFNFEVVYIPESD